MNKIEALNDKALEAAVLAHDKEEAAMRGEPDPWADERPEDEFADRKAAMAEAIRAYLSAVIPAEIAEVVEQLRKLRYDNEPQLFQHETVTLDEAATALTDLVAENARLKAEVERLRELASELPIVKYALRATEARLAEALKALDAIIERSNNDPLGTSKVNDMRRIAEDAARRVREGGKVE